MPAPSDPMNAEPPDLGFSVSHQKIELDIDLPNRSLKGRTEITINPHYSDLSQIRLNCRQSTITRLNVNSKPPQVHWQDPYSLAKLPWKAGVHQYHMLQQKLEDCMRDPPQADLVITIPKSVKIQDLGTAAEDAQNPLGIKSLGSGKSDFADGLSAYPNATQSAKTGVDQAPRFTPITVRIEYVVKRIRDGMQFVGWEHGDLRYPHAFSVNSPSPGSICCLFPCVDLLNARSTWEIAIKCQKTLGHALPNSTAKEVQECEVRKISDKTKHAFSFTDEDKALDLSVVCTGDVTDEILDPEDPTKKTTSFICTTPISAQHLGFAIGPFEHADLTEFRESEEEERLGQNAVSIHGYCLPGRLDELKNTCLPMAKAIDHFTTEYGSYAFSDYKLCFVDDSPKDILDTGSLSICSNRLLFPEDIIEPIDRVTRQLVHAIAVQWMGINVIPKESCDLWIVVGIAYFMTDSFMRILCGNNDYRYNQKIAADRVVELDINRLSLHDAGSLIALDPLELEFMELKAPLVMFILDRRVTKAGNRSGLTRIIYRIFLNAKVGDLANGAVDTESFIKVCEKVGHLKLDTFKKQWVEGAGCPKFRVTQRFNKKKLVVEMMIQQVQSENIKERDLDSATFMRDVKEEQSAIYAGTSQPAFAGPMTIRIHEADGTPYEHIVEIKDVKTTFEIPYNTKYKRLKRNRRAKDRSAPAAGVDYDGTVADEPLINCLGDVLDTEEEETQWRLAHWSKDDEDKMNQESYEWIRMDADFEWICKMTIQMPAYMFVSQLRQDRDVVAQMESIQFMSLVNPHELVSTELVRTLMDERYFHGIRTAAAEVLARNAVNETKWIGQFHLEKVFQHFFCYNDSQMTKSNDFSSRASFYVQCAIVKAMAQIRDPAKKSPFSVRKFLYEKLKYNDNSSNELSDCHYVATLMRALAEALAARPPPRSQTFEDFDHDDDGDDEHFYSSCLEEIDRHRRIDEWIPSYHNVLSTTALDCTQLLTRSNSIPMRPADFLQHTADGTSDHLRLSAFSNIMAVGLFKHPPILRWFLFVLGTDPSPHIRDQLIRIFGRTLGAIGIGEHSENDKSQQAEADGLVIEQDASTAARAHDIARKKTVLGALDALKDEVSSNQTLKIELWNAITSPTISLHQMGELLLICELLYTPETTMVLSLKWPRYWTCHHIGRGKVLFRADGRVRTTKIPNPPPLLTAPAPPPVQIRRENSGPTPSAKLIFKTKKPPLPPMQGSSIASPGLGNARGNQEVNAESSNKKPKPKLMLNFGKLKGSGGQGSPTP